MAQATTWKGSAQRIACRAALGHHVADPVRGVGRHMGDLGAARLDAQGVEERAHGGAVTTRRGPHQPAAVVVDHHGQVLVAALVGDLIDADPAQPGEPIDAGSRCRRHTRAMIAPTVRQAIRINCAHRGFRARHGQPGHRSSKARVCPAPCRAHGTRRTVGPCTGQFTRGASASRHDLHRAQIQAPPPAPALTPVIPGRPRSAAPQRPRARLSRPARDRYGCDQCENTGVTAAPGPRKR